MAGIYFHIPYCKTRCIYCDFFSSTQENTKSAYVEAMCQELEERKNYLQGQKIDTVYFGGGTPSQLTAAEFEKIFTVLGYKVQGKPTFTFHPAPEVTLEANPDDITLEYLQSIAHLPFNRISLGVQSFDDAQLKFLHRRHDTASAIRAVKLCQNFGFDNISIDLMYGLPNQTPENWKADIRQALALNVQHLSAYHLIYESGTPLYKRLEQGKIQPVDEDLSVELFEILIDSLTQAGFEHYEISNFSRHGFQSRHNSSYWNGTHYLGIGASAHSYNGKSRQWNAQVRGAEYRVKGVEIEILDEIAQYNDFIITRLRTMQGISLDELQLFGEEKRAYCFRQAQKFICNGLLEISENHLRLTRKGIFVSDGIMSDLMLTFC